MSQPSLRTSRTLNSSASSPCLGPAISVRRRRGRQLMMMISWYLSVSPSQRSVCRSVVCEVAPTKRLDYVEKRARQVEKRRIYNNSKKSEIKTRLKKWMIRIRR
ncbi:30S ribosomal protein S20, chloroplastic-like [Rosa chinensis]|uniref:30S ribosomal protein S20, chloroplastic-like n=1 Tax=Rosa chinensis TaxID=74649 RepID=UPI001AD8A8BC|nr:30S ribosomal protein S20, chloroplastic-like [Rosa chinensis]